MLWEEVYRALDVIRAAMNGVLDTLSIDTPNAANYILAPVRDAMYEAEDIMRIALTSERSAWYAERGTWLSQSGFAYSETCPICGSRTDDHYGSIGDQECRCDQCRNSKCGTCGAQTKITQTRVLGLVFDHDIHTTMCILGEALRRYRASGATCNVREQHTGTWGGCKP